MMKTMHISVPLLFLFIGSTSTEKQGNFGVFNACTTKNSSLRLECKYAKCPNSPSYDCEFLTSNRTSLANASDDMCIHTIPDHFQQYNDVKTNYICILKRQKRMEEKNITIGYKGKGKDRIKPCPDTTGLLLHQTPTVLWPVLVLPLWRVLVTDRQMT